MTWKEDKHRLIGVLTKNEYREINDNLLVSEVSNAYNHRSYKLTPSADFSAPGTNSSVFLNRVVTLSINYMADTVEDYDSYYEEFISVVTQILKENKGYYIIKQPKYEQPEQTDNKYILATVVIGLGITKIC